MMEWIKNIAIFLVIAGLILEMIEETKYYKFVRWVIGVILMLQLLKPFADTRELWERFTSSVHSFDYAMGTERVMEEIYAASEGVAESVQHKYETMIAEQVANLLNQHQITLLHLETEIGKDGALLKLHIYGEYKTEETDSGLQIPTVVPVEPVIITEKEKENESEMMSPFELYLCERFAEFYRIEESRICVKIGEAW